MKCVCGIALLLLSVFAHAQTEPVHEAEQQLEWLSEDMEDGQIEDDVWAQQINYYLTNPLNLNTATENELKLFNILSTQQIQQFIRYRKMLGAFLSVYELQAIPLWDVVTIEKLLPFVTIGETTAAITNFKHRFNGGKHQAMLRYSRVLEKARGYKPPVDSSRSFYTGSPDKLMLRYKYQYKNLLQYGITATKDAGEPFPYPQSLFDFYSFHLFAREIGNVSQLALGDYTVNMGQGLIHWQSLAFNKGAELLNTKRQSEILRPYNAGGAFYFNRGAAINWKKNNWQTMLFGSYRKLDGNIQEETEDTLVARSINMSGYHRTETERARKHNLHQLSYGGNITYKHQGWYAGFNWVHYHYNTALQKRELPYNLHSIEGSTWQNYSVDYGFTYKNLHFFGETAIDKNQAMATINGALLSLHKMVDVAVHYRNMAPSYQSINGNAFSVGRLPNNERGLYWGSTIKPIPSFTIQLFADVFKFPWLRYRVHSPSYGKDYLIQLHYKPNKITEVYTRFNYRNRPLNQSVPHQPIAPVANFNWHSWRTQLNHRFSKTFYIRQRVELVSYRQGETISEKGFMLYTDFFYQPKNSKWRFNTRLQYFETDGYLSRIYAFENDVLYYYNIPPLFNKASRYYCNIRFNLNKNIQLWLKWSQFHYINQASIGSGLNTIEGPRRSEIRFMLVTHW